MVMRPMYNQCINSMSPGPGHCPPGGPMPGHDPFYNSPFPPYLRRHTPYFGSSPDYRVYEMNKRLQQRTEESDNLWWDAFATEFFEDDATLTLAFCLEDGPKRYTIGRTLIPRYFRSIFEGGVTELSFHLKHPKESFHNTSITLDCEQCTMITHHGKSHFNKAMGSGQYPPTGDPQQLKDQMNGKESSVVVCSEGRLILEFTFDDLMRIKSWHFATRQHQELIPRSFLSMQAQQDPSIIEQIGKNITRQGLTNSTLNYLRLCVILEPMQELMSRHKAYALSPRDCLKTTLFQKWQRMVSPPETQRPPSKRRKRKSSATNNANATGGVGKKKNNASMSPGPPNFTLASQDVMVVGEPSLMGGEFGDEDERLITRLENTQYDPSATGASNGLEDSDDFGSLSSSGGGGPGSASNPGLNSVSSAPPTSWAGGTGAPTTTSGSVLPTNDSRSGSSTGSNGGGNGGPTGSQEDKKPSPLSQ